MEFVRPKQQEKSVRKLVKYAKMYRSQSPRGNQRNWNNQKSQQLGSDFVMYNKACFVCGSFDHVHANCNYHQRERVVSGNNYTRENYSYSAKKTHPSAQRNMVPRVVLIKTSLRSLNTARPVNTAHPKTTVYSARPMLHFSKSAQSIVKRPYQTKTALTNKNSSQKVNTAKGKVYTARPKAVNTTRPNSAVVNAMRANPVNVVKTSTCWVWRPTKLNSALITLKRHNYGHPQKQEQGYVDSGCSRHMTGNMSYLSSFKELDGGYVTFGGGAKGGKITRKGTLKTGNLDFEDLADESQVLFKVPRKNNMYSVDMKNIIPKECLTCLVVKATLDESMLWHRRLGHVNFKTINKLVKENLVRGLPSKHFENDQTCVAYLKGKQHKASFVTDDYSRFTWVFFLASKDATTGILKNFITEIENLVDKKKGIKREFSVARTPQQNGVAERRNRKLIENRVLVVKPHNKTPYELFRGKFDGKSDKGFFFGYSLNSKAFRVYIIRTRKVEENLHIRFLEDKPVIVGDGPKWLFDIDVLTKSMNYVPVVAGTNSNDLVGKEESIGAGHSSKETRSSQDCILMPLWKDGSLFYSFLKNASNEEPQPSSGVEKKDDEGVCKESGIVDQEKYENSTQGVNTVGLSINTEPDMFSLGDNATHANFFSGETEVDMSNITTAYPVPSTPNTRIHKDHSLDHVIGDMQSGVLTRRMKKTTNEQGFINSVWTLVDLPLGKRAIGTKWVYKNKKDERVAKIKAIRLFLVYASFKDFVVYQIDVKSAFLYGKIEKEVYVCQPLGFEDPEFPDRVYKVEKALYGLHQAPRACQDKYVDEILKKFGFSTIKTASTPIETLKLLLKDAEAEDVNVHLYRSIIGSLMYLTSSRPDIIYLKGQPKLGLWYPKDSPFDLEAYSDSDYAGASLDRKSTIGAANDDIQVSVVGLTFYNLKKVMGLKELLTFDASSIRYALTIQALVDGKKVIVTETSVRRALQLKDAKGTECQPNATIFAVLERMGAKTTTWNEFSSTIASAIICLATNQKFNFSKYIFDNMVKNLEGGVKFLMYSSDPTQPMADETENVESVPIHSNDLLLRDKKLERRNKSRTPGLKRLRKVGRTARIESSEDEGLGDQEDASKQRRKIADLDADVEVTLVNEAQGRIDDNLMFDTRVFDEQEVEVEKVVSTAEVTTVSATPTTIDELTLAQTLIEIKAAKPKVVTTAATTTTTAITRPKARGVVVQEPREFTTTTSQPSQLPHAKDKGKGKMVEPEKPLKKKDQILVDEEIAQRLQEELQAELEEEERLARQKEEEDNLILWYNTQAMMEADYELAQRLQAKEHGELTIEERSKLFIELMDKRKKHFAKLRAEEIRIKPPTKAQMRNQMCTYLNNMANYKHKVMERSKSQAEVSKKRTREELESDNSKKQKIDENVEAEVDDEEEMKRLMEIVPDDEVAIDDIPLATKSPIIVDWKIIKEGKIGYFQIIRADGSSRRYSLMIRMLQNIDREELETLWKLVKAKHGNTRPETAYERVL
ncbi:putative ribonuclease H-like domain-containing protein [Tanacetum coccineum]|uniref:Ribonuclease H-like domain-containing protein n=1 Tax=Tanacetum coccineum TaxID=301880 RepID=A0ABQ4ZLC1_9ASTR